MVTKIVLVVLGALTVTCSITAIYIPYQKRKNQIQANKKFKWIKIIKTTKEY